ncbi:hypothetical protein BCU79_12095 [Vibrio breoganii]|nr:hypothetical protein BCU79_12095 [Vibrio breoganii]PMI16112.1 hypothetical protein BCU49_02085 [Vibrio breoganii]
MALSFLLFLLFYCWLIFRAIDTASYLYFYEKLFKTINILFPFVVMLYVRRDDIHKMFRYCITINVFIGFIYLWSYGSFLLGDINYEQGNIFNTFYLNFGLLTGYFTIVSYCYYIYENNKCHLFFSIVLLSFIVFSGARGPLLISVFVIAILSIYRFRSLISTKSLFYLSIFVVISYYFILSSNNLDVLLERSSNRLLLLFSDDKGASVNTRLVYLHEAIKYINENIFFGYGFGSYGSVVFQDDSRLYPHNILIEIFFELGLIGLCLFLLFLLRVGVSILNISSSDERVVSLIGLTYFFINALKSNSLIDHRLLFISIIIPLVFTRDSNEQV